MVQHNYKSFANYILTAAVENNELMAAHISQQSKVLIRKSMMWISRQLFPTYVSSHELKCEESPESLEIERTVVKFLARCGVDY